MKTTTLGRTGLEVSRIAFGTWQVSGEWGSYDAEQAQNAAAVDVELSSDDLAEIERITADGVQVTGASPEGIA